MSRVRYLALAVIALGTPAAPAGPTAGNAANAADSQPAPDQQIVRRALDLEYTYQRDLKRLLMLRDRAVKDHNTKRANEINTIGNQLDTWRRAEMLEAWDRLSEAGRESLKSQLAKVQQTFTAEASKAAARKDNRKGHTDADVDVELANMRRAIEDHLVSQPPDTRPGAVTRDGNAIVIGATPGAAKAGAKAKDASPAKEPAVPAVPAVPAAPAAPAGTTTKH